MEDQCAMIDTISCMRTTTCKLQINYDYCIKMLKHFKIKLMCIEIVTKIVK